MPDGTRVGAGAEFAKGADFRKPEPPTVERRINPKNAGVGQRIDTAKAAGANPDTVADNLLHFNPEKTGGVNAGQENLPSRSGSESQLSYTAAKELIHSLEGTLQQIPGYKGLIKGVESTDATGVKTTEYRTAPLRLPDGRILDMHVATMGKAQFAEIKIAGLHRDTSESTTIDIQDDPDDHQGVYLSYKKATSRARNILSSQSSSSVEDPQKTIDLITGEIQGILPAPTIAPYRPLESQAA